MHKLAQERSLVMSTNELPNQLLTTFSCDSCSAILDNMGANMEVAKYTEKLVPSTRFVAVDGVAPKAGTNNFVAPSASVIGSVSLGEHSRYMSRTRSGDVQRDE